MNRSSRWGTAWLSIFPLARADPGLKTYRNGTHRLVSPATTLEKVWRLAPAMGITRIANITGLDSIGIPVVTVIRPNSRSLAVAQGKGLDLVSAKASGLMESVESWHGEHIALPLVLASYEEIRYTHVVVDPGLLPKPIHTLFQPERSMLWIEGFDLLQDRLVWVPFESVHLNYTVPRLPGAGSFAATSTGLASGNHVLEATSHAICEVVERDAATLWGLRTEGEQHSTRLDLATVDDPGCCAVLEKFASAAVGVAVWEITSDIGIPAFLCMIVDTSPNPLRPLPASACMGCHPVREVALARALTEAAQSRLTYISGSRDDLFRSQYEQGLVAHELTMHKSLLRIEHPMRSFRDVVSYESDTFADDLVWELERLHEARIESVIIINLTQAIFGIPVVRVVIPRLEPPDVAPGFGAGARAQAVLRGSR
jgi:YcaO-like protein with predicted kinase domain